MTDWKLPWDARCRCDRVQMRVSAPPLLTMACHCKGCQRMTGGAYSLSIAIPKGGFEVVRGETVIGGIHGPARHHHCEHCKSWLFTEPDGMDFFVNLRASMLDDTSWFAPFIETYVAEGFAWAKTGAVHSFDGVPELSAYEPLVAEFAQRGPHP